MLVLALDTALGACSVAVFDADRDVILASASEAMERGHAERLIPLVAESATRRPVKLPGPVVATKRRQSRGAIPAFAQVSATSGMRR